MNFAFGTGTASDISSDALVVPLFESDISDKKAVSAPLSAMDKKTDGLLLSVAQEEGFRAKSEQTFVFHTQGKLGCTRIILVGLGNRQRFVNEALRQAMGRATKAANRVKGKTVTVALPPLREVDAAIQAVVEGAILASYRYDKWKTSKEDKSTSKVDKVTLVLPEDVKKDKTFDDTVKRAVSIAEATNFARDLVNEPAETMSPVILAQKAKELAKTHGLKIAVGDRKKIESLKMGMFLGVARGSVEEPQLIHLTYTPSNATAAAQPPLCLVGKAITFDSGGLSLKPSDGMLDMKVDMAGSAAVLGAMKVVAHLKPPFPVHALMGACENMPAGNAYKLGDVLVSRLGKTVEITNTDAEGRLVLGDILAYANELKPAAIIDLATLTGACMVALGPLVTGAFAENDQLVWSVLEAAGAAGEEMWRLPLTETVRDVLKSEVADMKNAGDRLGGSISAALFLKEFIGETPWVHLDIAGPSNVSKEKGYQPRGASGVGVRTLSEFIRMRANDTQPVKTKASSKS